MTKPSWQQGRRNGNELLAWPKPPVLTPTTDADQIHTRAGGPQPTKGEWNNDANIDACGRTAGCA
jgi:hypothetical protein